MSSIKLACVNPNLAKVWDVDFIENVCFEHVCFGNF